MPYLELYAAAMTGLAASLAVDYWLYRRNARHAVDCLTRQLETHERRIDRAQGDANEALSRARYTEAQQVKMGTRVGYVEGRVYNLELPAKCRTRSN